MENIEKFFKDPKKALFTLAIPIMIGNMVQVLYNVVDTAFVGRLGAPAIAAITFSLPLFFLLMSLNAGIGTGMSSRISRMLGAKKTKEAENTAIHGLLLSVMLAVAVFFLGQLSIRKLFILFGARDHVLELAMGYMEVILLGVFFMFPMFVIHSIFTSQGDTRTPVIIQVISLVINIILDPIFIYTLGYGIRGAAIATFITFCTGLIIGGFLIIRRSRLRLNYKNFRFSAAIMKDIFRIGAPASIMIMLMSFYVVFLNWMMAGFGTEHLAAFGIVSRLDSFVGMPVMAFSLALMTLTGMFYGSKRYEILRSTIRFGLKIIIMIASAIGVVFFMFPETFFRIFTDNEQIIEIGIRYMRIDVFTFPLMAGGMSISRIMQGLGYGLPGLIINLTRVVFVAVPLAWSFIFILGFGFLSIAVATVIGGIVANIIAIIWLRSILIKIEKKYS